MSKKPNGFVIYRGPSLLNGHPITVVVNGVSRGSKNTKTGAMLQTYILVDGMRPVDAARMGEDVTVCGDCKHRPSNLGSCYVTLVQGPNSTFKALQRGIYPDALDTESIASLGAGRIVRLGTYGDPMAVPVTVWQALISRAAGHTGYTHQWHNTTVSTEHRAAVLAIVMASVDSADEACDARAAGYRYFRVRPVGAAALSNEVTCPASKEAGHRRTCMTCKACSGGAASRASIVINVHGSNAKRFALSVVA